MACLVLNFFGAFSGRYRNDRAERDHSARTAYLDGSKSSPRNSARGREVIELIKEDATVVEERRRTSADHHFGELRLPLSFGACIFIVSG